MRLRERQEQSPPDDTPLTPSKEGRGAEVYEQQPEDSIGKQQEPRRRREGEEVRRQQQQTKRQQEHARTTVPASRKEDLIGVSLRRAGSGAEDAEILVRATCSGRRPSGSLAAAHRGSAARSIRSTLGGALLLRATCSGGIISSSEPPLFGCVFGPLSSLPGGLQQQPDYLWGGSAS